ncbi:hypothetical protein HMI56_005970, partial [Coelomomyces lativittatus]
LYASLRIPLSIAVTGGTVNVPTLKGEKPITLSPGTQPNEEKVLKKEGVQDVQRPNVKGDLIFRIQIVIPKCPPSKKNEVMTLLNLLE